MEETWLVDGEHIKVKETLGVVGAFPRWIGIGNLTRNLIELDKEGKVKKNETRFLSSMLNIGDSALENQLKVADGFPEDILDENQIIIPKDFADYLGFNETPAETLKRTNEEQILSLTFDLFSFVFNFKNNEKVAEIIFEKENIDDQGKEIKQNKESKGVRFLKVMGLPEDYTFGEFFNDHPGFGRYVRAKQMAPVRQKLGIEEDGEVSKALDFVFKRMKRDDFKFTRPYKVKNHFQQARGKWSSAISNSVFLDSKKFHIIYSDLFFKRFVQIMFRSV